MTKLTPRNFKHYYVFLASPGDVNEERKQVRRFFEEYNQSTAHRWNVKFEVIDWENYSSIGVGNPQELIERQILEKYKDSLALVIGILAQRFGSPTGKAESGTEQEFNWALERHNTYGFPEIKWFFRNTEEVNLRANNPEEARKDFEQLMKVLDFRKKLNDLNNPIFYKEYPSQDKFYEVFGRDLRLRNVSTTLRHDI